MVAIPGVKFVARLAGKIPGYKGLAKIGVGKKARNTMRIARNTAKVVGNTARAAANTASRGVGAIRNGATAAGKKSRNVVRGTRRGFAKVRRFFGLKSRASTRRARVSRRVSRKSVKRSAKRSVRNNKSVLAPIAAAPIVAAAAAPVLEPLPAINVKNANSPITAAVGNMVAVERPY